MKYEDLLDNTKENVTKIYDFLRQSCSQTKIDTLCATVKKGNYNKWKKDLSAPQVKIFNQVANTTLKSFNYETFQFNDKISPLNKIVYELHDKVKYWVFLFEINVVDGIKIRFFNKKPFNE